LLNSRSQMKEPPKKTGEPRIKWINVAKYWNLTYWAENRQKQEFFNTREEAEKRLKELCN